MEEGGARRGWRDPGAGSPDPATGEMLGLTCPVLGGGWGSAMAEVGYLRERERVRERESCREGRRRGRGDAT